MIIMLVYFLCTLFLFVCSIKCIAGGASAGGPVGGAFYASDKQKKCAQYVKKHITIEYASSQLRRSSGKGLIGTKPHLKLAEEPDKAGVTLVGRHVYGDGSVLTLLVHVPPLLHQQLHELHVTKDSRHVEGSVAS